MRSTHVEVHINAPRDVVFRLLIDPLAIAQWRVPDGMSAVVHAFDAREGGVIRVSLTYDDESSSGKSTEHTDTYHGRFIRIVPNEQVVEVDTFEADDPNMRGEMISTITLAETDDGGTVVSALHENLPAAVSLSDNETGWRMSLAKLAALAEHRT